MINVVREKLRVTDAQVQAGVSATLCSTLTVIRLFVVWPILQV